jgi:hypothetical protein
MLFQDRAPRVALVAVVRARLITIARPFPFIRITVASLRTNGLPALRGRWFHGYGVREAMSWHRRARARRERGQKNGGPPGDNEQTEKVARASVTQNEREQRTKIRTSIKTVFLVSTFKQVHVSK